MPGFTLTDILDDANSALHTTPIGNLSYLFNLTHDAALYLLYSPEEGPVPIVLVDNHARVYLVVDGQFVSAGKFSLDKDNHWVYTGVSGTYTASTNNLLYSEAVLINHHLTLLATDPDHPFIHPDK